MGIFDSISRGFALTVASLKIAFKEPWMIALPFLSGLLMLALIVSFIFLLLPVADSNVATWGAVLALYLIGYFLFYFTQAMIVFGAKERFAGRDPTFGQCFSSAMAHAPTLLILAAIGATIGLLMQVIGRDKNGRPTLFGQILSSLIGVAWTLVSYFSLPVILNEDKGVLDSFKRSVELVTKAWGEGMSANLSLSLLTLPGIVLMGLGLFVGFLPLALLGLLAFVAGYALSIPAKAVISQALYVYATTQQVPTGMEADHLAGAFAKK
ncbi:Uncharacterised protein [uncultured archaeon]|nr:Uncharacterised protein [uncultured archaeon]